ncbi:MAG: DUF5024 domain-containing protein [Muribaculaceae bacterium]|nr:DUF5024 domain-containing protein [Muribaculaceae bacterium]
MNKYFVTVVTAFVVAIVASFSCPAQARIDRIIKDLEKAQDVVVTYTERRDPKSKKMIKQSIILNGNSKKQCEMLWSAFEQERDNSVSVTKTRNRSFIIKFQDKNNESSYVLSVSGTSWSLVVTKRAAGASNDDMSWNEWEFNFDGNDFAFNSLDGLGALGELNNLEGLSELNELNFNEGDLNGDVTVYDSDGNVIYRSKSNSSKGNTKTIIKSSAKSSAKSAAKSKSRSKSKSKSTSISVNGSNSVRTVTTSNDGKTTTTTYYL